jgi:hypothetical protein
MATLVKNIGITFVLGSLALLSEYSLAGAADVVSADGTAMKFEYQDDKLRINTGQGETSYMLLRDEHIYVVTNSDGQLMVIDANQAMGMFGSMAGAATPSSVAAEVVTLEATGRLEQHAGITGEVYNLQYIAEDGKKHQTELVLAEDARARAFSRAIYGMARSLSKSAGKDYASAANDMQERLIALNMGVLRYGDDMVVSAISDRRVDTSRFELPAEPTDLSSIGSLMNLSRQSTSSGQTSSGEGQKSGGVISSFLGALSKGKTNEEGAAGESEQQGDGKETDENADGNSLKTTFGKLFGK